MEHNLPTHKKGDTFQGQVFRMQETIEGVPTPIDLTDTKIRMDVRQNATATPVLRLSNYALTDPNFSGGGISIIGDPVNGEWQIDPQVIDVKPTTYVYDVEFSFPVTEPDPPNIQTLINGSWTFTQDITHD